MSNDRSEIIEASADRVLSAMKESKTSDNGEFAARDALAAEYKKLSEKDFAGMVEKVATKSKDSAIVPLYYESWADGTIKSVTSDDSWLPFGLGDTVLFNRPDAYHQKAEAKEEAKVTTPIRSMERAGSNPLQNSDHEKIVQNAIELLNLATGDSENGVGFAKLAAQHLCQEALKLPKDQRQLFLERATFLNDEARLNDRKIPGLNIVFGDLDKDGKRDDLSDMKLNFLHPRGNYGGAIETIDLFDP